MTWGEALLEAYRNALGGESRAANLPPDEAHLETLWSAASTAWPGIHGSKIAFIQRLGELSTPLIPPAEHASDIYLALRCAEGDEAAVEAFTRHFAVHIHQPIARVNPSRAFCDDATQVVHEKLFVGHEDSRPKISEYSGQIPLRNWLRIVSKRTAMNLVRGAAENAVRVDPADADLLAAAETAPELRYMKALYKQEFEAATQEAFRSLSSRERTLLKLHLGEQMTLAQVGAVYEVSHATAARWLTAVREKLAVKVRETLTRKLALTATEFDGLADLVRSQIDVRVLDLLRSTTALSA